MENFVNEVIINYPRGNLIFKWAPLLKKKNLPQVGNCNLWICFVKGYSNGGLWKQPTKQLQLWSHELLLSGHKEQGLIDGCAHLWGLQVWSHPTPSQYICRFLRLLGVGDWTHKNKNICKAEWSFYQSQEIMNRVWEISGTRAQITEQTLSWSPWGTRGKSCKTEV